ncbi:hypothetical protein KSP40_PGU010360 [Platanthera guangdongensis]|uniref:FAD-dependent oxidoreductase 2 FAD-binding domain-containing protein n=1 Tax=Platanthera guangdongensis TaxID=2320717 RepID=A0ABR2MH82_9ASPA
MDVVIEAQSKRSWRCKRGFHTSIKGTCMECRCRRTPIVKGELKLVRCMIGVRDIACLRRLKAYSSEDDQKQASLLRSGNSILFPCSTAVIASLCPQTFRLCCKGLNSFLAPSNYNNATRRTQVLCCLQENVTQYFDFIVVGSGVAGLSYAIEVSKHGSVAIITKAESRECNTNYAQGGVSAVFCPSDSVESHMHDTIVAGGYLCDEETVRVSFSW